jgi:ATP adenylyltransferase
VPESPLWAPWRMEYVGDQGPKPACIFCELPQSPDLRTALVLSVEEHFVVMLNRFPYNNGHLMVAPRQHTADLAEISTDGYQALMSGLRRACDVVGEVLSPDGMNVGINLGAVAGAGIADHLHWHIVPRWNGDTNFMPVLAETRVMPQHLEASYDMFHPHF